MTSIGQGEPAMIPVRSEEKRLATPEERYRHEIVDVEQRCELPERTLRLRRKIGVS
jgi:hypothetical protein